MPDPVVDFFPRGSPLIVSDRMAAAMRETLDRGAGAGAAYDAMEDEQVAQLRDDPGYRDRLRAAYAEAGVDLVVATMMGFDRSLAYAEGVRRDLARWQARFDAVDWLRTVTTPAEAREAVAAGDVGVLLCTQNLGEALAGDPGELTRLHQQGVRCAQLTYNSQNDLGAGCTERGDGGLTHVGVDVVERLLDRDVIVDLSHAGRRTTLDAIEVAGRPVAFTHTFAGALADHDRAKSDEELAALREADGYMGVLAVPFFLEPGTPPREADFGTFFDHVEYAVDALGVDRVGIGTDWGSWTPELPTELHDGILELFRGAGFREEHGVTVGVGYGPMERYEDWGVIPEGLEERGFSGSERRKLLGGNFLSFWERATDR